MRGSRFVCWPTCMAYGGWGGWVRRCPPRAAPSWTVVLITNTIILSRKHFIIRKDWIFIMKLIMIRSYCTASCFYVSIQSWSKENRFVVWWSYYLGQNFLDIWYLAEQSLWQHQHSQSQHRHGFRMHQFESFKPRDIKVL